MENLNASSKIDTDEFCDLSRNLRNSVGEIDPIKSLRDKLTVFMLEAETFVQIVKKGNLKDVRKFIEGAEHLFRGSCGNRHVDFIAYKPDDA